MKRALGGALTAAFMASLLALAACGAPVARPAATPTVPPTASASPSESATPTETPEGKDQSQSPSTDGSTPQSTPQKPSPPKPTATASRPVKPKPTATASRPVKPKPTATASKPVKPKPTATASRPPAPTCTIPASLRGKDLEVIPTSRKIIALTFDAGGAETGADRILATLKREGVPATFFLTGRFVERYPATARKIAAAHLIGNHTHTHPDLTKLSDDKVRMEIWTARAEIMDTTGKDPKPYFRFPYGEVDAHRIRLVNQECYVSFRWTTDSLGWQGTSGGRSVESVTKRVLDGARPGGIVLMHVGTNPDDGSTLDADALPGIIAGLRAKGYRFVALDAVL